MVRSKGVGPALCVHGDTSFDWFVFVLEFKSIIPMSVQHIIFVGEVFQIEISDGLVHPLGSRQNVSLSPALVITGA